MRCELTNDQWAAVRSMLPNKPRGARRVDDRRLLNGIFWELFRSTMARSAAELRLIDLL